MEEAKLSKAQSQTSCSLEPNPREESSTSRPKRSFKILPTYLTPVTDTTKAKC